MNENLFLNVTEDVIKKEYKEEYKKELERALKRKKEELNKEYLSENDKKELEQTVIDSFYNERINILKNLFYHPSQITLIESDFGNIGKKTVSKITIYTNLFFFLVFISMFFPFFFKTPMNYWIICVIFFVIIAFFGLKNLFKCLLKTKSNGDILDYFKKQMKKDGCNKENQPDKIYKMWIGFSFISPFSIRHIWWWILIIGIIGVQYETLQYINKNLGKDLDVIYLFCADFNHKTVVFFINHFLKLLIISVIAFIATNVIRELIQLREKYVKGNRDMTSLVEKIDKAETIMNKTDKVIEKSLYLHEATKSIINFLSESKEKENEIFDQISDSISKNLTRLIKNITDKLTNNKNKEDEIIQLSLLSSFNSLLYNQSKRIGSGKEIFTQWSNLGTISIDLTTKVFELHDLLKKNDNKYDFEIYALQLKTPYEFIRKYLDDDSDWKEFINGNIFYRNRKIIKRYFATIDIDKLSQIKAEECPAEVKPLLKSEVKKKLKCKFNIDDNNISTLNKGNLEEKVIISNKNGNNKTVAYILSNIIHNDDCCFIRKFDAKKDYYDLLYDKVSNKLIDYLVIRKVDKNDAKKSDWVFCVKSLYDQDLDVAKVELLYSNSNSDVWDDTKKNLNKIFFDNSGKIVKISEYFK